MAVLSSNLFAHLCQETRFTSAWKRHLKNGKAQIVNLRKTLHLPKPEEGVFDVDAPMVTPLDITNFKEALFALAMMKARKACLDMGDDLVELQKGITVEFSMTFLDKSVHPDGNEESQGDLNNYERVKPPKGYEDKKFYGPDSEQEIDTIVLAIGDGDDAFIMNMAAHMRAGLVAMACN